MKQIDYQLAFIFRKTLLLATIICLTQNFSFSQDKTKLSLEKVLSLAASNNLAIKHRQIEKHLAHENVHEQREEKLPEIGFHASYARITDLTEFRRGLTDKVVTQTIPVIADVTTAANLPLYTGGKIKYQIKKAEQELNLANLKVEETSNDTHIEVVASFLRIYKLEELQKLILENIKEEEDRLKEVKSFRSHGTVTKNEVLRAELQLSEMQIALMSNKRNIEIALHELKTMLQIPKEEDIDIDTTNLINTALPNSALDNYLHAATNREILRIARAQEEISITDRRIIKSNYYPKIHFFAKYAFNYPNYMFFPPNPYLYTLGFVGIDLSYSISNIYKNKTKMKMADQRIELQENQKQIIEDKIADQVFTQYSQYQDILDRIPVNEKSVALASENYRIIKTKYLNQLALITDMIDADTALLQTKYNSISTKIDAIMKYHELLHASGINNENSH